MDTILNCSEKLMHVIVSHMILIMLSITVIKELKFTTCIFVNVYHMYTSNEVKTNFFLYTFIALELLKFEGI